MIVSIWKIRAVAFRLSAPQRAAAAALEVEAQGFVRAWALPYVPTEVRLMAAKYPVMQDTVSLTFKVSETERRYRSICLENFPLGQTFLGTAELNNAVAALGKCREWQKAVDAAESLEQSLRCAMHKINTYARFKIEFPEAYEILLEVDKENGKEAATSTCDAVESVRAKLKAKPKTDEKV